VTAHRHTMTTIIDPAATMPADPRRPSTEATVRAFCRAALVLFFVAFAAGLCGGCGGTSQPKTVTVQEAASGPSSPAAGSTQATTQARPVGAYLEALDRVHDPNANPVRDRCNDSLDALTDNPGPTWDAAAKACTDLEHMETKMAEAFAAVTPPQGLKQAHQEILHAYASAATTLSSMTDDLGQHQADYNVWTQVYFPRIAHLNDQLSDWRIAVLGAAAREGANVPAWVREVGKP
jgi:hypothetical protein